MKIQLNRGLWLFASLAFGLASVAYSGSSTIRPTQTSAAEIETWQTKLYESGVNYQDFACELDDKQVVADYFRNHPLTKNGLPICHNDCPVIKCRPVVPFPAAARSVRVAASGTIAVHVLVDEKGKVLYARVLDGHHLLREAVRGGACRTQFADYPYGKHQGVMHFMIDGYDFIGVPNKANEVR
jgi:hypothetical protein